MGRVLLSQTSLNCQAKSQTYFLFRANPWCLVASVCIGAGLRSSRYFLQMQNLANTTPINLCRALKLKNRLASRLSRLDSMIGRHNSSIEGNREYNVRDLYERRMRLAEQLVQLKVDISAANGPVQRQIFEVAECKSLCSTLQNVDTRNGPHSEYGTVVQQYEAQFRKPDIDKEVRRVEREIDRLQDELDDFNYKTTINVPKDWLNSEEDF